MLSPDEASELSHEVAGLPTELDPEAEEAKRFDLLILNLQLAILRAEPAVERLRDQVKAIAGLLEEKSAIPMVREQMPLIQDLQTNEWWQNVTTPMLEVARRRLRDLVKLIEKPKRKPIYTDFADELGSETSVALPGLSDGADFAKFRAKPSLRKSERLRLPCERSTHSIPTELIQVAVALLDTVEDGLRLEGALWVSTLPATFWSHRSFGKVFRHADFPNSLLACQSDSGSGDDRRLVAGR